MLYLNLINYIRQGKGAAARIKLSIMRSKMQHRSYRRHIRINRS
jgi:hypothetical protein